MADTSKTSNDDLRQKRLKIARYCFRFVALCFWLNVVDGVLKHDLYAILGGGIGTVLAHITLGQLNGKSWVYGAVIGAIPPAIGILMLIIIPKSVF